MSSDRLREIEEKRKLAMSADGEHGYILAEMLVAEDIPWLIQQIRGPRDTESADAVKARVLNVVAGECYTIAREHGFHNDERNIAEALCLIHSEVSEALEAVRTGNPHSDHITEFSALSEELADIVIRVFDLAVENGIAIGPVILSKMAYNKSRKYKHGKEF